MSRIAIIINRLISVNKQKGFNGLINFLRFRINNYFDEKRFKPHYFTKEINNLSIKVKISNLFAQGWYEKHHIWTELEWILNNMLTKNEIIADCGANNGFISVAFAKSLNDECQIFSFEPIPSNIQDIKENILINEINSITLVPKAIGSKNAIVNFVDQPNGMLTEFDISNKRGISTIDVEVITLDEYFVDIKPTFLKIDVEGFENEVLKGAQGILKLTPKLAIEIHTGYHNNNPKFVEELFNLIELHKYNAFLQFMEDTDDGIIHPYNEQIHTSSFIAKFKVVHLFAVPK